MRGHYREDDSDFKFGIGLLIGAALGGIAALLVTPKTGEDRRKEISEKFGSMMDKARSETSRMYYEAKDMVNREVKSMKDKIDKSKYSKLVSTVLSDLEEDGRISMETREEINSRLLSDWENVKKKAS